MLQGVCDIYVVAKCFPDGESTASVLGKDPAEFRTPLDNPGYTPGYVYNYS